VQKNMLAAMVRMENALGSTVSRAEAFEREQRAANGEFQRRALETEAASRERRLISEAAEKQSEARINALMQQLATQQSRIDRIGALVYELGRDSPSRPHLRQQSDEHPSGCCGPSDDTPPAPPTTMEAAARLAPVTPP
jgi:hypothetical protein